MRTWEWQRKTFVVAILLAASIQLVNAAPVSISTSNSTGSNVNVFNSTEGTLSSISISTLQPTTTAIRKTLGSTKAFTTLIGTKNSLPVLKSSADSSNGVNHVSSLWPTSSNRGSSGEIFSAVKNPASISVAVGTFHSSKEPSTNEKASEVGDTIHRSSTHTNTTKAVSKQTAARTTKLRSTRLAQPTQTLTATLQLAASLTSGSTQLHNATSHATKSHTIYEPQSTSLKTTHHPLASGDKIIAHPIPGSTWDRIRKILLIPLCTITVLTFFSGLALYIAATWGSGEGWFGQPLSNECDHELSLDEKSTKNAEQDQTIACIEDDKKPSPLEGTTKAKEIAKEDQNSYQRQVSTEFQFRLP
ncbi:uncharacterized protein MEPE_06464 [Melanopsichium pennsylvanicum]|uniref:Uncharacterized protein n=1 Tax=Melanopsichium pennsylvanicum TaxID=63383 RepID=A0AAJ4XSF5_9BASI|nr:uncharacterized protein MEPE_06464 [Melanopsichium pennsylvanicum]